LNKDHSCLGIVSPEASGQHDVGHLVVATGRGVLRLSSSFSADVFCIESVETGTDIFCAKA